MRRARARWYIHAVAALSLTSPLAAQEIARLPPEQMRRIEEMVAAQRARIRAPGISLAIVVEGAIAYARGFGLSRVEDSTSASAATLYRAASIAKPMTATAVMQLAAAGRIELDAAVQRYCPAYPDKKWTVTVRQLLGHIGGVRHPTDREDATTKRYPTVNAAVALFAADPLLHEPGQRFAYSTLGYVLLACVIEGASGESTYMSYLEHHVLAPAGMTRTMPDTVSRADRARAGGYRRDGRRVRPARVVDTSFKVGLVTNVIDLARFAIAVQGDVLVRASTRAVMWTPVVLPDGSATPFGLGWQVGRASAPGTVLMTGQQEEVSGILLMDPERRFAVAILSNLERSVLELVPLLDRISAIFAPI